VNECKLDIDKEHTHAFKNVKLKIGMWFEKNHLENHFHFSLCNSLCKSFFSFFLPIYFLSLSLCVPFSLVVSFFSVPLSIYCFFLHVKLLSLSIFLCLIFYMFSSSALQMH
jgi:hypothetical protein